MLRMLAHYKGNVPKDLTKLDGLGRFRKRFVEARSYANQPAVDASGEKTPIGQLEYIYLEMLQQKWLASLEKDELAAVESAAAAMTVDGLEQAGLPGLGRLLVLARLKDGTFQMVNHRRAQVMKIVGRVGSKQI